MRSARGSRGYVGKRCARAVACVALFSGFALLGCAHQPAPAPRAIATRPAPPAPAAAIDWLPADAFALVHGDIDQLRALLPSALLAGKLQPALHELLERTHTVTIALVAGREEPLLSGVFVGDYDARINPLLIASTPRTRKADAARELWLAGDDVWLHTPEGYWLGAESELAAGLLVAPAMRAQQLSAHAWTAAPREPYLASALLHVSPPLRAALKQQAERESFAALVAQVGPALLDLDDVRVTLSPDGDGLRLLAGFAFGSELGAQSGSLVLRGVLAILGARVDPDSELSRSLDAAQIDVAGKQLRAQIALDGEQLGALARTFEALISKDAKPPAPIASAVPAYEPPSADLLAERERNARAEPAFAKVVDLVLAQAGTDIELRPGNNPQTGKPGKPFLIARVPQQSALAQRQQLGETLRGKGFVVVPVTRGFNEHPTELGIFKARDEAATLIARGTGDALAPGTSKQLATLLRKWQASAAVQLSVADVDYFAVELTAVPADPDRFVKDLLTLCPKADADQQKHQLLDQRKLDCFLQ